MQNDVADGLRFGPTLTEDLGRFKGARSHPNAVYENVVREYGGLSVHGCTSWLRDVPAVLPERGPDSAGSAGHVSLNRTPATAVQHFSFTHCDVPIRGVIVIQPKCGRVKADAEILQIRGSDEIEFYSSRPL